MMYSSVRVVGQQFNPLLTVLPLGVLGSAVLSDLGALVGGVRFFGQVAYWDMAAGLIVGVAVLSALLVDLVTAPAESYTRRMLGLVSAATSAMVLLFGIVWLLRAKAHAAGNLGLLLVELLALGAGIAGAWLARGWASDRRPVTREPIRAPGREWVKVPDRKWARVPGREWVMASGHEPATVTLPRLAPPYGHPRR